MGDAAACKADDGTAAAAALGAVGMAAGAWEREATATTASAVANGRRGSAEEAGEPGSAAV